MATIPDSGGTIHIPLSPELMDTVEAAAVTLGSSVSEFSASAVVREAQRVLEEASVTRLSNRDRDILLEALNNPRPGPNEALREAARCADELLGRKP